MATRLSNLVPGVVMAGGRRTVTRQDIADFANHFSTTGEASREPQTGRQGPAASGWMICAMAQELAAHVLAEAHLSIGALSIEKVSWPSLVHAGDELALQILILDNQISSSGSSALVRSHWVVATGKRATVLDLVSAAVFEDRAALSIKGEDRKAPLSYKVSKAAEIVGLSRYVLYEAIRDRELPAYRPRARADLLILAEDLREWITRNRANQA